MRLPFQTAQSQVSTSGREVLTLCSHALHSRRSGKREAFATQAHGHSPGTVTLLDYGAGNVRSVRNAVKQLGYTLKEVCHLICDNDVYHIGIKRHRVYTV